jgi:hypothetical protein
MFNGSSIFFGMDKTLFLHVVDFDVKTKKGLVNLNYNDKS